MAKKFVFTQGTDAYVHKIGATDVIDLACIESVDPGTTSRGQVALTCLQDQEAQFAPGLDTPGTANFVLIVDPQSTVQTELYQMYNDRETIEFVIGWADGTAAPTVDAETSELDFSSADRSFIVTECYISEFNFTFEADNVVKANVTLQLSGKTMFSPKAA
ncbi:phage tail tube protein [Salinicola sp. V024]|uniref:phage tail tube protein n=1 Tax=Salinicola sp. V024 TaxID=3459609 RepID=UPI0040447EC5